MKMTPYKTKMIEKMNAMVGTQWGVYTILQVVSIGESLGDCEFEIECRLCHRRERITWDLLSGRKKTHLFGCKVCNRNNRTKENVKIEIPAPIEYTYELEPACAASGYMNLHQNFLSILLSVTGI